MIWCTKNFETCLWIFMSTLSGACCKLFVTFVWWLLPWSCYHLHRVVKLLSWGSTYVCETMYILVVIMFILNNSSSQWFIKLHWALTNNTYYVLLDSAQCNFMNRRCELLLTYVNLGKHCSPVFTYISKTSILIL